MFGIRSSARVALSIGFTAATIFWLAAELGIFPNPIQPAVEGRSTYSRLLATYAAQAVSNDRLDEYSVTLAQTIRQNPSLISAGIRTEDGRYVVQSDGHAEQWQQVPSAGMNKVSIGLLKDGASWGRIELLFAPIRGTAWSDVWYYPLSAVFFIGGMVYLVSWVMLSRAFQILTEGKVVPTRVRSALNTLAEGLVLVNPEGEIMHANQAFGELVSQEPSQLVGGSIGQFAWSVADDEEHTALPWQTSLESGQSICGVIVELHRNGESRKYMVNASPIQGADDQLRGILVSFDDVTVMESKKVELAKMIQTLRQSRDEVERQNEQLQFLANCDPLTKCFNRRSFWSHYEDLWHTTDVHLLNVVMVDVDHFKNVNDQYGHSVGDDVLRETGELLREKVGAAGLVCRYGGEEFAILMPHMDVDAATARVWEIHTEFQRRKLANLPITASFGISNGSFGALDLQHMLDQADQCLYAAKRKGRNTVVRYDQCEPVDTDAYSGPDRRRDTKSIEYSAVTGLLSALAFRCQKTAEHSMRVADLAVAIGKCLLNKRDLYRLEICALLHDIGKIGVPDAILHKPGKLTDEEWAIMRRHDQIGVEIVRSAFASEDVAEIIRSHHMSYAPQDGSLSPLGNREDVLLESRIITACDALDSMLTDSVYRRAMSMDAAIREMQRCTPDQFDPVVVDLLVDYVKSPAFQANYTTKVDLPARSVAAIGRHLEGLYDAVANEDIGQLRHVVEAIRQDRDVNQVDEILDTAIKLDTAISQMNEFEDVLDLANEMMQLCRSTRATFLERADIVNPSRSPLAS